MDKFIGDVVMAVFGAPVARGDDTARAIRAALAMRSAARSAGRDLRAGVNRGDVFWSAVGGDRPTVIGDAVNVAQRLQSNAAPGTVLASRTAWEASGNSFDGRARGALELKGRSEAVEAFEVEALPPGVTKRGMPGERATPFLGREGAIGDLRARFESGRGGLVVVRGAPGSGKSRLLAEFRRLVRMRHPGAWVVTGRELEAAAFPRPAFAEVVRESCGVDGAADPAGLARALAADLGGTGAAVEAALRAELMVLSLGLAAPGAGAREVDPVRLREETIGAWSRWIRARAAGRPALLCFEDLQWAVPDSRNLLEDLVGALEGEPVLFAGAARPEAPPLARAVEIALDDLSPEAAQGVASGALGGPVAAGLSEFLSARAGGNPLYIEELCRYLRDRNLLAGPPFALASEPSGVPAGLHDLLVAQADLLSAPARESMKTAGVVGGRFWIRLLDRLIERESLPDVREAETRAMVASSPLSGLPDDAEYTFRHALIRDALYSLVPKKERVRIHARVADDLSGPGRPARMDLLSLAARHAESAGEFPRAASLWMRVHEATLTESTVEQGLRAAREAVRLGQGVEAVVCEAASLTRLGRAGEALARLEGLEGDERAGWRVLLARSSALVELGRVTEGLESATRAVELAPAGLEQFRAQRAKARCYQMLGRMDEAMALVQRGLRELDAAEGLPAGERDQVRVGLVNIEAIVLWFRGQTELSLDANTRELEIARRLGSRESASGALHNQCIQLRLLGRHEEALESARESLRLRREIGDRGGVVLALNSLGACLYSLGRFGEAIEPLREGIAIARESNTPEALARVLLNLGFCQLRLGGLGEALATVEESVSLRRHMNVPRPLAFTLVILGRVRLVRQEVTEALAALREAEAIARESVPLILAEVLANLAQAKGEDGDSTGAIELAEEALREAGRQNSADMRMQSLELLAVLKARAGDGEAAVRLANAALEERRAAKSGAEMVPSWLATSEALRANDDASGAEAAAAEAIRVAMEHGMRPEEAWGRARRAEALGSLGRKEEAAAEMESALAIFRTLGAPALVERASRLRIG